MGQSINEPAFTLYVGLDVKANANSFMYHIISCASQLNLQFSHTCSTCKTGRSKMSCSAGCEVTVTFDLQSGIYGVHT